MKIDSMTYVDSTTYVDTNDKKTHSQLQKVDQIITLDVSRNSQLPSLKVQLTTLDYENMHERCQANLLMDSDCILGILKQYFQVCGNFRPQWAVKGWVGSVYVKSHFDWGVYKQWTGLLEWWNSGLKFLFLLSLFCHV